MILNDHNFFFEVRCSDCSPPAWLSLLYINSLFSIRLFISIPLSLPLSLSLSFPGHPRGGTLFRPQLAAASQLRGLVRTTIWWVAVLLQ